MIKEEKLIKIIKNKDLKTHFENINYLKSNQKGLENILNNLYENKKITFLEYLTYNSIIKDMEVKK